MALIQVAARDEIPPGSMKSFHVGDIQVLVANCDGDFYAINNVCTHAGGHLSEGRLEGFVVRCPRHGSSFDVRTGACVAGPKIAFLKLKTADIASYPVTTEGEAVKVEVQP
jgi:3-phenylpropionate/trans-cinnamate dioxygenase ferredoxin subunit